MINLIFFRYVLTIILQFIATAMLIPIVVSFIYKDGMIISFIGLSVSLFLISYLIKPDIQLDSIRIKSRDIFLINFILWVMVCLISSLPYFLFLNMDFTNSLFEAVSGITTTGASIMEDISKLPQSIQMWRQLTNWMGGIGFMSIGLLVFSNLNIGEMKLIQLDGQLANKVFPQYRLIAIGILKLYFILTSLAILAYYLSGMDLFNSIAMAFSSVSTGGFSPENDGLLAYGIISQYTAIVILIISSLPFVVYLLCYKLGKLTPFFQDPQIKAFFILLFIFTGLIVASLIYHHQFDLLTSFKMGLITAVNFMSTSGFSQGSFDQWGPAIIVILVVIWAIGGASGSTSAGLKIFRFVILMKILAKSLKLVTKPKSVQTIYFNGKELDITSQVSVVSFLLLYLVTVVVFALLFTITGMDLFSSFSTALNVISNIGPSMGAVVGSESNFAHITESAKWLMSFGMLLGRLELTAVLVLLLPSFWKF